MEIIPIPEVFRLDHSRHEPVPRTVPQPHAGLLQGGRYELLEFVSKGGMGAVYRARDISLNRSVAIKCILDLKRPDAKEIALSEARTLAALEHENIMRIYDILVEGDQIWIVSEWLQGRSLAQLHKPMSPALVMATMTQVFEGLAATHAASVYHRDIKPENIMIADHGRVAIIDFGVAFRPGVSTGETVAGSLRYTDPRILEGRPPDAWSDLFSAAMVMMEMLTGEVVLPNLAPLPLYRHCKRHLPTRVEMMLDGIYPPLADLARNLIFRTEGMSPAKSLNIAKDAAKESAAIFRELSDLSAMEYLHCFRDFDADPDAELRMRQAASSSLQTRKLTPQEKAAWAAFDSVLNVSDLSGLTTHYAKKKTSFSWSRTLGLVFGCALMALFPWAVLENPWDRWFAPASTIAEQIPAFVPPENPLVLVDAGRQSKADIRSSPKDQASVPSAPAVQPPAPPEAATPADPRLPPPRWKGRIALPSQALPSQIFGPSPPGAPLPPRMVDVNLIANAWAVVYLDDKEIGRLPAAKPFRLLAGRHTLRLENPYFETLEQEIEISATGEADTFQFKLVPKEKDVTLNLAEPGQLLVNGKDYGVVESKSLTLNFGRHYLEIRRPNRTLKIEGLMIGPQSANLIEVDKLNDQPEGANRE